MPLEIVTLQEFESVTSRLLQRIDTLEAMIKPFVESERDGNKILSRSEACQYVRLSNHGINAARREGRITGIKINEKEYGYRKSDLDRYLKRYRAV